MGFQMPTVFEVKVGRVGNSLKITLPKPACDGFDLKVGDTLIITVMDEAIEVKKKTGSYSNT